MAREVNFGVTGTRGIARRKAVRGPLVTCNRLLASVMVAAVGGLTLLMAGCGGSTNEPPKEAASEPQVPAASPTTPTAPTTPATPETPASPEVAKETPPDPAASAPATPAEPPKTATTAPAEPEPPKPISWGPEKITRSVPLPATRTPIVYAGPRSPYLFSGKSVIDAGTGESLGDVTDKWDQFGTLRALSPDGKAYAVGHADSKRQKTMIAILAATTGKQIHDFQVPQGDARFATEVEHIQFVGPRSLLTICRGLREKSVLIYDIVSATVTKQFTVKDFSDKRTDISPDGKYLVTGGLNRVSIYDLASGNEVAQLAEPPKEGAKSLLFADALVFSPSGTEIATTLGRRVICWNLQGAITYDEPCAVETALGGPILWIPDGSGWLVKGRFLMLRQPKLVVWDLRDAGNCHFLDRNQLFIVRGSSGDRQLILLPVPWEPIEKATAALNAGEPALIMPGDPLALRLKIGEVRFATREEAEQQLREAFTELCSASGIQVTDDAKLVLDVDYSEAAGETRGVVDRHQHATRPFAKPQTTGQQIQDTTCKLFASLTHPGETQPIWTFDGGSDRSHAIVGEVSDKALRDQVFRLVTVRIKKTAIPYFVPKDRQIPSLPLVSTLKE